MASIPVAYGNIYIYIYLWILLSQKSMAQISKYLVHNMPSFTANFIVSPSKTGTKFFKAKVAVR